MKLALVLGSSSQLIAQKLTQTKDNLIIDYFSDIDSLIDNSTQRGYYFDRILFSSNVVKSDIEGILGSIDTYLKAYCPHTNVVMMCRKDAEEDIASYFAGLFNSPLHTALLFSRTTLQITLDSAVEDIGVLKQKYGIAGKVTVSIEEDSYDIPKPVEPAQNVKQPSKKRKGGFFSRFAKDKNKKVEPVQEEPTVAENTVTPVENNMEYETNKNYAEEESADEYNEGQLSSSEEVDSSEEVEEEENLEIVYESPSSNQPYYDEEESEENWEEPSESNEGVENYSEKASNTEASDDGWEESNEMDDTPQEESNGGWGEPQEEVESNMSLEENLSIEEEPEEVNDIPQEGIGGNATLEDDLSLDEEDLSLDTNIIQKGNVQVNVSEVEDLNLGEDLDIGEETYRQEVEKPKVVEVEKIVEKTVYVDTGKGKSNSALNAIIKGKTHRIFLVTGDRGSGVTTTAWDLAKAFSRKVDVLYVDMDFITHGLLCHLEYSQLSKYDITQLKGITLCKNRRSFERCVINYDNNLDILTSDYTVDVTDENVYDTQSVVIEMLQEYPVIIFDVPLSKLHLLDEVLLTCTTLINVEQSTRGFMNLIVQLENMDIPLRIKRRMASNGKLILTKCNKNYKVKDITDYVENIVDLEDVNWLGMPILPRTGAIDSKFLSSIVE